MFEVLLGFMIAECIQALYSISKKEKQMLLEGGEPLPTSSYLFLGLRYLLRGITIAVIAKVYPVGSIDSTILLTVGFILLVYVLAFFAEVIIRSLVILIVLRLRKDSEKGA